HVLSLFISPSTTSRSLLFPYTTLFRSRTAQSFPVASKTSRGYAARMLQRQAAPIPGPLTSRAGSGQPPITAASRSAGRSRTCCRSEEHTSELQSPDQLVCRTLSEKKNN